MTSTICTYLSPFQTSKHEPICDSDGCPIYWIDQLLEGGFCVPDEKPILVMVTGDPGVGKSLFVQQILLSRALHFLSATATPPSRSTALRPNDFISWYITTETSPERIQCNLEALGYENPSPPDSHWHAHAYLSMDEFTPSQFTLHPDNKAALPLLLLIDGRRDGSLFTATPKATAGSAPISTQQAVDAQLADCASLLDSITKTVRALGPNGRSFPGSPSALAIDSLNVLAPGLPRDAVICRILDALKSWSPAPRLVFLVLDTPGSSAAPSEWEYLADVVIHLGKTDTHTTDEHVLRHIEFRKARFQGHAYGKHLIKLLRKPRPGGDREGPRPNTRHGGVFAIPSLHFLLSKMRTNIPVIAPRRSAASRQTIVESTPPGGSSWTDWAPCGPGRFKPQGDDTEGTAYWPIRGAFELVGGGVPLHRCVALLGPRGPRRGRFAYRFLLDGASIGETTLVVSFRDNDLAVNRVLDEMHADASPKSKAFARPQVVFIKPGFVTPEEVFHKIATAVAEFGPQRIIVNAIDNWGACYPLLDKSPIFMTTLVDFFDVQQITSMVICVTGTDPSLAEKALVAEAGIVLEFRYAWLPWRNPTKAKSTRTSRGPEVDEFPSGIRLAIPRDGAPELQKVVVRPVRVPRATGGLRRAVLDWNPEPLTAGRPARELVLWPLAPEFPAR